MNIPSSFTWPKVTFQCFLIHENHNLDVCLYAPHPIVHLFFNAFSLLHTCTDTAWSNGSFSLFFFLLPPHTSVLFLLIFLVSHFVFRSPPSFPFLCHSKLELIRLTSQISHRLVAHFISVSPMWLHSKLSSPPHPIDVHPQPPFLYDFPLICQTFRIGASWNLLHTRALPGNLMCCFAFSVFIRGKWVLKLLYLDLREALIYSLCLEYYHVF